MTTAAAPKKKSRLPLIVAVVAVILLAIGAARGRFGSETVPPPEVHLQPENVLNSQHEFELTSCINPIKCFNVTNTLLSSWLTTLVILAVFVGAAARRKLIPGRFQGLIEMIVEGLYNFVESVVGKGHARRVFPVIATIFIFVLFNAWMGLLPFYTSFGFLNAEGHVVAPLFRSAGTDMNMPLAVAIAAFLSFEFWGFKSHGFGYTKEFIRVHEFKNGIMMGSIQMIVGFLEFISHFIRVVSFTFRLFGNMLAGEVLLGVMTFLIPFTLALPFYVLELMVGGIQALVFAGLTLAFTGVGMASHGEEPRHEEGVEQAGHAPAPAH